MVVVRERRVRGGEGGWGGGTFHLCNFPVNDHVARDFDAEAAARLL